jgi:hypothetical protein
MHAHYVNGIDLSRSYATFRSYLPGLHVFYCAAREWQNNALGEHNSFECTTLKDQDQVSVI